MLVVVVHLCSSHLTVSRVTAVKRPSAALRRWEPTHFMPVYLVLVACLLVVRATQSHHRRGVILPSRGYDRTRDPDLLPDDKSADFLASERVESEIDGCNGYVGYCNKRVSQVLWIGAHNALSDDGFALQRNQFVDGAALLDAGIRYFDIDTCAYAHDGKRIAPMVCHGYEWWKAQLYQPTSRGLHIIKAWLDVHPREVIFLNFGDIADFMALDDSHQATPTRQLHHELLAVVRSVFGTMAVLRGDPWDRQINLDEARIKDLIAANRRVIVNVDKAESDMLAFWGQDDRVCNDAWYAESLHVDVWRLDYDWTPVLDNIEENMRNPCANSSRILRKLEFAFYTALGGTVDSSHVGAALAKYMERLKARNQTKMHSPPYAPFNLVLTDHSDKWRAYYSEWHANQINSFDD
ncbi:unnamed protein product [Aphanomyces euteiches]